MTNYFGQFDPLSSLTLMQSVTQHLDTYTDENGVLPESGQLIIAQLVCFGAPKSNNISPIVDVLCEKTLTRLFLVCGGGTGH